MKPVPSPRAQLELKKLGADIAIARKRRRFTQQRLADGAGVTVKTIRCLEQGQGSVCLGTLAMVLMTLGESGRLADLLDAATDDIGLTISINQLPKRVFAGRRKQLAGKSDKDVDGDDGSG